MTGAAALRALHDRGRLLVLPNAWDALSARLVREAGAAAIATSSAAVAWALGHPDGEALPLDDLCRVVAAMARVVDVPMTVDLERGYGADPRAVSDAVLRVVEAGAAGVNLEDAAGDADAFAARLAAVRSRLGDRVFVNARTCVVLKRAVPPERSVAEVLARARRFEEAGADGLFVPMLTDPAAIAAVARGTALPLNVLVAPGLPGLRELAALGVRRVSAGVGVARAAYARARDAAAALLDQGSYEALVHAPLTYPYIDGLFGRG